MSRFLIFGANYAPEPLGNAPYTTAYAETLVRHGHRVTVVAGYTHYPQWTASQRQMRVRVTEEGGVRLVRVPHAVPRVPDALGRLRLEATFGLAAMGGWIRGGVRADAVIGVLPTLSGGLAARVAGAVLRRPTGILVQDLLSAVAAQAGVAGASDSVARAVGLVERLVLRGTRVAVVARGFEAPVLACGAREAVYLPNFTTLPSTVHRDRRETRMRLGIPPEAFLVTYSGSLGYKQDFANVIAAGKRWAAASDIWLLVVGEGGQQALVQEAFASGSLRGRWLPLQPAEEVPDVLAASDLLLAPQRPTDVDMAIPSKLTAYFASGRPVVAAASAASETARQVEESGGGLVVAPGDHEALAEAVLALREDGAQRARMGAAGAAYARDAFDRARAEARFVAWAEALVARRPYRDPGLA